ncbi:hypothetical protein Pan181_00180 [Aeoliella mucimassa]|uniref:Uncharacterized protein n=2 Tax=Aeoliella mucimassa TaxID=2527972 RepID=A0A518AGI2_9BACT|nr:hypothetical protein Pan181_00180 [Aeoliella mucimassa]
MEEGYTWLDHVLAGGLFWRKDPPEFNPLLPGPTGETIFHSHLLNKKRAVKCAYKCLQCESITILREQANA